MGQTGRCALRIQPTEYLKDFRSLAPLLGEFVHPVILASAPGFDYPINRYSIFSAEPIAVLTAERPMGPIKLIRIGEEASGREREFADFPSGVEGALGLISARSDAGSYAGMIPAFPVSDSAQHRPFTGGLVGTIAYEEGGRFERMPKRIWNAAHPSLWFGVYPVAYVADHARREGWLIERSCAHARQSKSGATGERIKLAIENAKRARDNQVLADAGGAIGPNGGTESNRVNADWRKRWRPSLDEHAYGNAVGRILDYLKRGDAYQVNLTVRHRREFGGDPARLFATLARRNPAPFSAYLEGGDWSVISSSPELLLRLRSDGGAETRPIKGTIRRGEEAGTGAEHELARRLADSGKDRAEHLMIVDLERNDLGRVCRTGSVHVDPFMRVESYTGLHHLVSGVKGRVREGIGPAEVLGALFPGGSVTGAPKIRAMEVIAELEPVPRGFYTGAIGWISREGEACMNLAIRTMICAGGMIDLHVGGGIVIDSEPEKEAEECGLKGAAMAAAVEEIMDDYSSGRLNRRTM